MQSVSEHYFVYGFGLSSFEVTEGLPLVRLVVGLLPKAGLG